MTGRRASPEREGIDALLLRPDGHVARVAPAAAGPDLETELRRWFGEPTPVT